MVSCKKCFVFFKKLKFLLHFLKKLKLQQPQGTNLNLPHVHCEKQNSNLEEFWDKGAQGGPIWTLILIFHCYNLFNLEPSKPTMCWFSTFFKLSLHFSFFQTFKLEVQEGIDSPPI